MNIENLDFVPLESSLRSSLKITFHLSLEVMSNSTLPPLLAGPLY